MHEPRYAFRHVVPKRLPVGMREAGAGEAHEVVEHGEAAFSCGPVVLRWKPYTELAHVRITERIVLENFRDVLQDDKRPGWAFWAFQSHIDSEE